MEPTREDTFSGTCFSLDQNRAVRFRDLFCNVSQCLDGRADSKKWIYSLPALLRFFNQPTLLVTAVFQASLHHHQQSAWIGRLGEEIVRSRLYGFYSQVNRAMTSQNNDGNCSI